MTEDQEEVGTGGGRFVVDTKGAIAGGAVSALVFGATFLLVGLVGETQAMLLLQSTFPTVRFLASGAMTAAATILALMLTLLSFSASSERDLQPTHYDRIRHLSGMCVAVMVVSILLLLIMAVPLQESEQLQSWYDVVYYAILIVTSLVGGLLVAIVLTLQNAIQGLIALASPHRSSHLTADTD